MALYQFLYYYYYYYYSWGTHRIQFGLQHAPEWAERETVSWKRVPDWRSASADGFCRQRCTAIRLAISQFAVDIFSSQNLTENWE